MRYRSLWRLGLVVGLVSIGLGGPLPALPIDMPAFVPGHAKSLEKFHYQSTIGPPGAKDPNDLRFAFEVEQRLSRPAADARLGYTKDIGLITVAFYKPQKKTARRGILKKGTGYGDLYAEQMELYRGDMMPGELLGVVQIRYGE